MSVVGPFVILFVAFLSSGIRSPLGPLLCFITDFLIVCVSLQSFKDEVENPYADQPYTVNSRYLEFQGTL